MRNWIREHKNEIITGIIVFFLTSFLTKIGELLSAVAPSAGGSILRILTDAIYYTASHQSTHSMVGNIMWYILTMLFTIVIMIYVSLLPIVHKMIECDNIENALQDIKCQDISEDDKKEKTEELRKRTKALENKASKTKPWKLVRSEGICGLILTIFLSFSHLYISFTRFSFKIHLRTIPLLSDRIYRMKIMICCIPNGIL